MNIFTVVEFQCFSSLSWIARKNVLWNLHCTLIFLREFRMDECSWTHAVSLHGAHRCRVKCSTTINNQFIQSRTRESEEQIAQTTATHGMPCVFKNLCQARHFEGKKKYQHKSRCKFNVNFLHPGETFSQVTRKAALRGARIRYFGFSKTQTVIYTPY